MGLLKKLLQLLRLGTMVNLSLLNVILLLERVCLKRKELMLLMAKLVYLMLMVLRKILDYLMERNGMYRKVLVISSIQYKKRIKLFMINGNLLIVHGKKLTLI